MIIAAPISVAILASNLLVYMSAPAAIGGMIYLSGYAKAFSIGSALVAGWFTVGSLVAGSFAHAFATDLAEFPNERSDVIEMLLVYGFMAALSGVTVVAIRAISRL